MVRGMNREREREKKRMLAEGEKERANAREGPIREFCIASNALEGNGRE